MKYPVVEVFESIQGEGCQMGRMATFIRLGGCNLHCSWCDTKWDKSEMMTTEEILSRFTERPPEMVVITGGEPTIYDLTELLVALQANDHFVAIETNGTNSVKEQYGDLIDWVACSPKPQNQYKIHAGVYPDELKYVVDDNFDYIYIDSLYQYQIPIWLQPEGYHMQESAKKAFQMVNNRPYLRLGIQMHKIFDLK